MNRTVVIVIAVMVAALAFVTLPGIAYFLIGLTSSAPPRGRDHSAVSFDIAADGRTIVFGAADGDLHELDLASRTVVTLTQTQRWEQSPAYSADGQWIVYASCEAKGAATNICLRSRDGSAARDLTSDAAYCDDCPSFSPDGSQVVFARAHRHRPYSMGGSTWDEWDVYIVNVDGPGLRRITNNKHYQLRWPRFTADGQWIYYTTIADRKGLDLTRVSRIVDLHGQAQPGPLDRAAVGARGCGAWASDARQASDGRQFVYITDRQRPFSYDVGLCTSRGARALSLGVAPKISSYNNNPVLTPDNSRVLFLSSDVDRLGSADFRSLWEVRPDGSKPRQIADESLFTTPRSWNRQGAEPRS